MSLRTLWQARQTDHLIPVENQDKPLYGTGAEKVIPYSLSSDFIFRAEEGGRIAEIDSKNEICSIVYDSGKKAVIDLSAVCDKNSNGG